MMRITTGKYKNRKLAMPKGIRPTQDKVRKAIFDILGDVKGLSFLELFAGSGAVGFEAVSRGARSLALAENNRDSLLAIRRNMEALRIENCLVYPLGAEKAIMVMHKEGRSYDIIFLDPPYCQDMAKKTLQTLGAYDILAPYGFVVIQHFKGDLLFDNVEGLAQVKESRYGDTVLTFYRKVK